MAAIRLIARVGGAYSTTQTGESRALQLHLDKIAIFSNSWGGADGKTYTGPSTLVNDALVNGVVNGRGKLGVIYVWAGGNGGFDDNCNCDGYVNSVFTIGVNTVSQQHGLLGDSEPCTAVMTSTFSGEPGTFNGICTTDVNGGCMNQFSGTSAATPIAAGIIALALEANPKLTWRDVQHLIVQASDPVTLQFGDFQRNGAGKLVSDWYGFGLLNALTMTNLSTHWKPVPNQHICQGPVITTNMEIPANTPPHLVSSQYVSSGCNGTASAIKFLEHVTVWIEFKFSFRGGVQFTLESPSHTISKLLTRRNYDTKQNSYQRWTFMTVQHWGEDPVGVWTLNMSLIQDHKETGTLEKWKLILYGTKTDPALGRGNEPYKIPNYNIRNGDQIEDHPGPDDKTTTIVACVIGGIAFIALVTAIAIGMRCKFKKRRQIKQDHWQGNN